MSLGQSLIAARKAAGQTLDSLSVQTNIRVTLLTEFEANRFHHAGGDTYARGHLRTLARVLNVDPEVFLDLYDQEHAIEKRAIHEQLVESNATFPYEEKSKLTNKNLIIISIVAIFSILIASVILNSLQQSAKSPKVKPTQTQSAAASPSASNSATSNSTQDPTATSKNYSSGSGVEVKLDAVNGASWLFVSDAAGITLFSGRASEGESYVFSSTESVNLRIGNAGAVKLTVNGSEVPSLGGDGEVVNVSYGVNS